MTVLPLAFPQFFRCPELYSNKPPGRAPSERLHRPHRSALRHMDLNVIRKSPIFLGQVIRYSLRNRPYEALKRGLARWQVTSILCGCERIREDEGGQGDYPS